MLRIFVFLFSTLFGCQVALAAALQAVRLPEMNALDGQSSVSGLSSGGFMASQFHVAYSEDLVGAGIVAGGPWNCAGSNPLVLPVITANTTCMNPCHQHGQGEGVCPGGLFPQAAYLAAMARQVAFSEQIDSPDYLADDHIYLFSGGHDMTVVTGVVDTTAEFYRDLGVDGRQIVYQHDESAGHGFITDNPGTMPCDSTKSPYINNCHLSQALRILETIYGQLNYPVHDLSGDLIRFDQSEFFSSALASMDDDAYVYIPQDCYSHQCRVHIALHGCAQGISVIGKTFIEETGYLEVADSNRIIVLFPQVKKTPHHPLIPFLPVAFNPHGCWDFWGYSSGFLPVYYTKSAPQMVAIKAMLERLVSEPHRVK